MGTREEECHQICSDISHGIYTYYLTAGRDCMNWRCGVFLVYRTTDYTEIFQDEY